MSYRRRQLVNGERASFNPIDVPELVAWWSASRGVVDFGETTFTVPDQIDPAADLGQASTTNQPTPNVLPDRLTFDHQSPNGDSLERATAAKLEPEDDITIIAIVRFNSLDTNDRYLWSQWVTTTAERMFIRYSTDIGTEFGVKIPAGTSARVRYAAPSLDEYFCEEYNFVGGVVTFRRDGEVITQSSAVGTMPATIVAAGATLEIGTFAQAGANQTLGMDLVNLYLLSGTPSAAHLAGLRTFENPKV